jgi:choline-sulfatase
MYIAGGIGDVTSLIRDPDDIRAVGGRMLLERAGPGESDYTLYDRQIAADAQVWLHKVAARRPERPWVLFVSSVAPHFPLTAPPEHFYTYDAMRLPSPKLYGPDERMPHPYLEIYGRRSNFDAHFNSPDDVHRALAGYFGLVSFMDEQVAKILRALRETGLAETTRIAYCSDHGDSLGARGLWGKSTMYEESAGVPLILVGTDVPNSIRRTPVTLCDLSATILEAVGAGDAIDELGLEGTSLFKLAREADADRVVMSQFHTMGPHAFYMLRTLRYKYVYYVGFPPQLFDLEVDPEELHDLGEDSTYAGLRDEFEARLRSMLDPEEEDRHAKAAQAVMVERYGGMSELRGRTKMAYSPPPKLLTVP